MPWGQFLTLMVQLLVAFAVAFVLAAAISVVVEKVRGPKPDRTVRRQGYYVDPDKYDVENVPGGGVRLSPRER